MSQRLLRVGTILLGLGASACIDPVFSAGGDNGDTEGSDEGEDQPCESDADCPEPATCSAGICQSSDLRQPYRDSWREELVLPADIRHLKIGGLTTNDNFANRGDIEILHVEGSDEIRVELQRFTVAARLGHALSAFERMSLWAYAEAQVQVPSEGLQPCGEDANGYCQIRTYYDGMFQPLRDGANIRVTLPRGWSGLLELETEDNLQEGDYPDRGDLRVDGLSGHLEAELDSGRVEVRLDNGYLPFPGCTNNYVCEAAGLAPDCGCTEFGHVRIEARSGQAADMLVSLPPKQFITAIAHNDDGLLALGCSVDIDCEGFEDCVLDPAYVETPAEQRAAINYPGPPALPGSGVRIDLRSGACAQIDHAEQPADMFEGAPVEVRGNVVICGDCL